jgi:hypothetical protein
VDRELGTVGIIGKNWVINNECNEAVKHLRLNSKLPTKLLGAIRPPVVKKVELR